MRHGMTDWERHRKHRLSERSFFVEKAELRGAGLNARRQIANHRDDRVQRGALLIRHFSKLRDTSAAYFSEARDGARRACGPLRDAQEKPYHFDLLRKLLPELLYLAFSAKHGPRACSQGVSPDGRSLRAQDLRPVLGNAGLDFQQDLLALFECKPEPVLHVLGNAVRR